MIEDLDGIGMHTFSAQVLKVNLNACYAKNQIGCPKYSIYQPKLLPRHAKEGLHHQRTFCLLHVLERYFDVVRSSYSCKA